MRRIMARRIAAALLIALALGGCGGHIDLGVTPDDTPADVTAKRAAAGQVDR